MYLRRSMGIAHVSYHVKTRVSSGAASVLRPRAPCDWETKEGTRRLLGNCSTYDADNTLNQKTAQTVKLHAAGGRIMR
jgi:hypothetical protein